MLSIITLIYFNIPNIKYFSAFSKQDINNEISMKFKNISGIANF